MKDIAPVNPFPIVFKTLSSPESKAFYVMRAQQDIGIAMTAIGYAMEMCFLLVDFATTAVDTLITSSENTINVQACLPVPINVAGYLTGSFDSQISSSESSELPSSDDVTVPSPIITPVPKSDRHAQLMKLSRETLREACRDRRISYTARDRKADLVEKLLERNCRLGDIRSHRIRWNGREYGIA